MKKTLTLLLALFAIGVTSSVRAEDAIKWELDPETSQNSPIAVDVDNGNKLRFTLPTGWSVSFKKKDNNDNKSYSPIKINEEALDKYTEREKTNRNTSPKVITK
ncbi:TPA: hypothetical protein VO314_001735, partial [Streptococcus pyogenes]|nr:hypothetical protein [Streptococcus pyogenes]HES6791539.1 hypothetical protein [Streptococcus pyogenes]